MSAAKRRVKRKIALLLRMDATAAKMATGGRRWYGYWVGCLNPLASRLRGIGAGRRVDAALDAATLQRQYPRGRAP